MTSRERVQLAINHQQPDRIPIDVGGSVVTGIHVFTYKALCDYVGLEVGPPRVFDVWQMLADVDEQFRQYFGIDVARVGLLRVSFGFRNDRFKLWKAWNGMEMLMPAEFEPYQDARGDFLIKDAATLEAERKGRAPDGGYYDVAHPEAGWTARMPREGYYFDVIGETLMSGELELVDPDEYRKSLRPVPDDDLEYMAKQAKELYETTDYALLADIRSCGVGLPLNFCDWMVAVATEREWCREILLAGAEHGVELMKLYHQALGDRCAVWRISGTDFGSQRGELFRPEIFEDLYVRPFRMVNDAIHSLTSAKTMIHTCGSVRNIIGAIADAGFDILNPVQTTAANMDPAELKAEFGDRLVFWGGGVETQGTLPDGTPEQVAAQVRERCEIFGRGGGFVFNTVHNIQANVPPENLVAMFEAVRSVQL